MLLSVHIFLNDILFTLKKKSNVFTDSKIASITEFLLCTRSCTKYQIYILSFNLHFQTVSCTLLLSQFCHRRIETQRSYLPYSTPCGSWMGGKVVDLNPNLWLQSSCCSLITVDLALVLEEACRKTEPHCSSCLLLPPYFSKPETWESPGLCFFLSSPFLAPISH